MVLINFHFTAEINRLCQEKDADNEKFDDGKLINTMEK
jgi:hypothetical protein